jgi:hypothetical protein
MKQEGWNKIGTVEVGKVDNVYPLPVAQLPHLKVIKRVI